MKEVCSTRNAEERDCCLIRNIALRIMRYRAFFYLVLVLLLASCGNRLQEKVIHSYDNGQPALVHVYQKDKCIKEIEYYEDGTVKMEGAMEDGHREGEWKCYFEDGKTQSTGFFHNGLRTGKAMVYHENGNLYMEGYYTEGHHSGKWNYYDEQGYLLRTDDYGE